MDANIEKGKQGEEFVNNIAYESFLKYWCFPGPLDIVRDNKEICDLLVVFYPVCLIISVKNYSFKGQYARYFRHTIDKAIRQINGAEKTLFREEPVLLKHPDRKEELFEKQKATSIHRIIVNLNQDVKFYKTSVFEDGKHYSIMDASAWLGAIQELNTLPDFVKYLESRLKLFSQFPAYIMPREEQDFSVNDGAAFFNEIDSIIEKDVKLTIVSGSELDLIAFYILNVFEFPKQLSHENANFLTIKVDGFWKKYEQRVFAKKEKLEEESYFIDRIVKEFLIHQSGAEKLAKIFFKMDRLKRAGFAKIYLDFHRKLQSTEVSLNRTHYVLPDEKLHFVFMYFVDDYPDDALKHIMELSMVHLNYLYGFELEEVCALGVSKNFAKHIFGHSDGRVDKPSKSEVDFFEDEFKNLGWKIKERNDE